MRQPSRKPRSPRTSVLPLTSHPTRRTSGTSVLFGFLAPVVFVHTLTLAFLASSAPSDARFSLFGAADTQPSGRAVFPAFPVSLTLTRQMLRPLFGGHGPLAVLPLVLGPTFAVFGAALRRVRTLGFTDQRNPELESSLFSVGWWGRRDSNPHARGHMILSHARLPIPTLPRNRWRGRIGHLARRLNENGDPPRGRTENLLIKSQLLCQLS